MKSVGILLEVRGVHLDLTPLCPYCLENLVSSEDHVFPRFFGGRDTIRACSVCNSAFGHSFEARSFEHFKDWMLMFRRCGMQPPAPMVWRRVALDFDGNRYDIDQDLRAVLSDPVIIRNDDGSIISVAGDPHKVKRIAASLARKGSTLGEQRLSQLRLDLRNLQLRYPLDDDLRRLTLKMSFAVARRLGCEPPTSSSCRRYLLSGSFLGHGVGSPVRVTFEHYPELKVARPPLGHLVYVHYHPDEGRCYSVVQYFGAIQLYCEIGTGLKVSEYEFAVLGTHDPVTHREVFRCVDPVLYAVPPQSATAEQAQRAFQEMSDTMRAELRELYGDQAPVGGAIWFRNEAGC